MADYGKFIGLAVAVVIAISLVPTVATTIIGLNTTGWTSLTGGSGALAIIQLSLLVFCAGVVIYIVKESIGGA